MIVKFKFPRLTVLCHENKQNNHCLAALPFGPPISLLSIIPHLVDAVRAPLHCTTSASSLVSRTKSNLPTWNQFTFPVLQHQNERKKIHACTHRNQSGTLFREPRTRYGCSSCYFSPAHATFWAVLVAYVSVHAPGPSFAENCTLVSAARRDVAGSETDADASSCAREL